MATLTLPNSSLISQKNAVVMLLNFRSAILTLSIRKGFLNSPRESPWGTTQRDQKARDWNLAPLNTKKLHQYCKNKGIEWFASAWDMNSLEFLDQFNCKYAKVASAMLADVPLLKAIASRKKHTFISTGAQRIADGRKCG